jgi:two-component system, OmpR family, response regulator
MRILVVDDEINIVKLIKTILEKEGYEVVTALDGERALDIYYDGHVDMIICDEMMPRVSGNEMIREIRSENKNIPIIMVTAKGSIEDKSLSFELGVDDYLVKPIDTKELIIRVKAIFRRLKIVTDKKIQVKDVLIDSTTNTVSNTKTGESVSLTKTEFDILYKLLSYPEKSFTKYQLFNEFWGVNSDTDESIIKVFILKIRKKIEPFPEIGIQTIMGIGYRGIRNDK